MSKLKILQQDCDPTVAEDKSLPYTSYLVEYYDNGKRRFDLVVCNKQVDIFDHYWDEYRDGFIGFNQSEGTINPKLWNSCPGGKKKK